MDEQLVLTALTLRLNPQLQRADVEGGSFVVKNAAERKYLTVTAEQWTLLRNFASPGTVPEVLRAVILNRSCLPLREFYELVLKALRAGVLQIEKQPEKPRSALARRWAVTLPPLLPTVATWLAAAGALVALAVNPFPWPGDWPGGMLDVAAGWGLLVAGLSLGYATAASVLRGGGGEVYDPGFRLWRPVPYFGVSLEDACMCDARTQVAVASARLFPVMGTAAVLWWCKPQWGGPHLVAVLVLLRPFAGGAVPQMLSTWCRGRLLDTQKHFLFSLNQRWRIALRQGVKRVSAQYVLARLGWGLAWVGLVVFSGLKAMDLSRAELFASGQYWEEVLLLFGVIVFAAVAAYVGPPAYRYVKWFSGEWLGHRRREWKRWRVNREAPVSDEVILRTMADSLLLRRLPAAERTGLAAAGQPRWHKAWSVVQGFADAPKQVSVILSGRAAVYRRRTSGRPEQMLALCEGDIFGAEALLDPDRAHVQVRALTPLLVLTVPVKEFHRRVISAMGVPLAVNLAQRVPFLRGLKLCSNWHPQALARFSQLASLLNYNQGELIVAERQDSQQFYIIMEGRVVVSREGRLASRLKTGAFFGEISLLQNSSAIAEVAAAEETRCLTFSKADFLRFVTHNPLVLLQLEEVSSKRLGRPVFPCQFRSFDVNLH